MSWRRVKQVTQTIYDSYDKRGEAMKIEVVPRFKIDGKYYTAEEITREKLHEIVMSRLDIALAGINYEKKKTA